MKIVCPKCELKGQVDVAPTGAKTRIACVRCTTIFEAVFIGGQMQFVQPQPGRSEQLLEIAEHDVPAASTEVVPSVETTVETTQESEINSSQLINSQQTAAPASDDAFFLTSGETAS